MTYFYQTEAEATVHSEVLEVNLKELVTNPDLRHEVDILRRDIHDMEQRLIIKLGALMTVSIGIVAALVKLL
jgi:predicted lipoprotein